EVVRLDHAIDERELLAELRGQLGPLRLVGRVFGFAVRGPGGVEDDGAVLRLAAGEELAEHRREAEDGVRVQPRPGGEVRWDGEEGAEDQPAAINEDDPLRLAHAGLGIPRMAA